MLRSNLEVVFMTRYSKRELQRRRAKIFGFVAQQRENFGVKPVSVWAGSQRWVRSSARQFRARAASSLARVLRAAPPAG